MQSFFEFTDQYPWVVANDLRRYFIVRSVYPSSRLGRTGDTWARERTSDGPGLEPGPHSIFMTLACVLLLIFIWVMQRYFPSN